MAEIKLPIEPGEDSPEGENANIQVEAEASDQEAEELKPGVPEELNILPLRESVIYPMLIAPLSVAREAGIQLIDESIVGDNRIVGVVAQHKPQVETPTSDDVFSCGCAVIIRTLVKMPEAVRLIVQGVSRFKIVEVLQEHPYLRAKIEVLDEPAIPPDQAEEVEAIRRTVAVLFDQAVRLSPQLPDELRTLTQAVQETNVMCDLIAAHMTLSVEDKQKILETLDVRERMRLLLDMLNKEVRVLELSSKVQSEVNTELSKSQRDYYLREQMKAIQRELGETDDRAEELEDLKSQIDAAGMPAEAHADVNREFDRLRRMSPGAPEYTVARTYIDWMLALPWNKSSEDNLDIASVKVILDTDHTGLDKIKERILEFLAVRKVKAGKVRQPILCFAGPPGVGKTSLGRSIARAMGRKFTRMSLGGMRDEAEIRGHRRTYIGALPGQIIQAIRRAETNNPVLMLDEIDKVGADFRGDPSSALLEVLDPEQNSTFRDHYIDAPFDLSNAFFITTANRLDTIPPPLRDRMEVIELGGYTEQEKVEIAAKHLIPKQVEEHGLTKKDIVFRKDAVRKLIHHYTREAGVRNLEREIAGVVRKVTRQFAEGNTQKVTVDQAHVETALGAPRFLEEEIMEREMKPGTAVGLAWTPVGGDVLFVESTLIPSTHGGLILTGQLGDVMKESATAALSYVRSRASHLHITQETFDKNEIHVHLPAGAVPKDGPSAGVTMVTALTSLCTGRPVKRRLAMTGEVTLSGQVLPVGGIKEKVLAAHRAGVRTLLMPEQNRKDFMEDIPEEIRKKLDVRFVKSAEQVLHLALGPAKRANPKARD